MPDPPLKNPLQGRWKNLHLSVPAERKMLSVYRGTLPHGLALRHRAFDALLLDHAELRGARIIGEQVEDVSRERHGKSVLTVRAEGEARSVTADFVVFATGINDSAAMHAKHTTGRELYTRLCKSYRPPRLRKALIFELERPCVGEIQDGELHYVECTENGLELDMCSILPKSEYLTVSLIGRSVDRAEGHSDNLEIIRRFLSRVLYQTYSSEQKNQPARKRHFERLLWSISIGDESYRRILWWMIRPRTLWQIFTTGFLVTLRSSVWETMFGLKWRGLGRFPVVVKREQIEQKLATFPTIRSRDRVYLYGIEV